MIAISRIVEVVGGIGKVVVLVVVVVAGKLYVLIIRIRRSEVC
jgi:hypothetical protein